MRAFVAIVPPPEALDALEDLQADLPLGRLVPPENLHLTLSFLGEVEEPALEPLHEALRRIEAAPVAVALAGLATFGGRAPQSLHIAAAPSAPLEALHRKVRGALHQAGLMPGRERFRPHVTLARFRHLRREEEARLAAFLAVRGGMAVAPFTARSFSLFESRLGRGAARYLELASYDLGAGQGTAADSG